MAEFMFQIQGSICGFIIQSGDKSSVWAKFDCGVQKVNFCIAHFMDELNSYNFLKIIFNHYSTTNNVLSIYN